MRSQASLPITPASGFVTPGAALIIGLVAGGLCYSATLLKARLKVDDALDVFAVHGVGGIFGALATGVFATRAINPLGQGAIDGKPEQIWIQFVAVAFTVVFAGVVTFVIAKVIEKVVGLRVSSADEDMGMDLAVHGEAAYQM